MFISFHDLSRIVVHFVCCQVRSCSQFHHDTTMVRTLGIALGAILRRPSVSLVAPEDPSDAQLALYLQAIHAHQWAAEQISRGFRWGELVPPKFRTSRKRPAGFMTMIP